MYNPNEFLNIEEPSSSARIYLVVDYRGDIVLIPFTGRDIEEYISFHCKYDTSEVGRPGVTKLSYKVTNFVYAACYLTLPDEDITTWEILYDCLINSTVPLSKLADTPAYPPSTDKSDLVKHLLDMDAVKACFRKHHPEIAERLDAAPGPIKIEELLPFKP